MTFAETKTCVRCGVVFSRGPNDDRHWTARRYCSRRCGALRGEAGRQAKRVLGLAHRAAHPEEHRAKERAYHAAHREERKAKSRLYYLVIREERRVVDAVHHATSLFGEAVPLETFRVIWSGVCFGCGQNPAQGVDHIIPFTKAGRNVAENLQPACRRCNSRKNNRLLSELHWLPGRSER